MATLKTNYKDDIYQGNRKYIQTKNDDGTVSFSDATQYEQEGDYFGANEINEINKRVNDATRYQKASGTGTAITLTEVTLEDGYQKTFIVAANNNGVATKINSKNLYKPGTTTSPNLIAGKAVTVWYDSTGDCFFIKASAEGNVTVADVLAGKSFSNDNDTGLVGTMVDNGSIGTKNLTTEGAEYTIPKGYHNGLGKVKAVIAGLLSSVIKAGTTVGSILGTYTSDGTVENGDMLSGKVGYSMGERKVGTLSEKRGGNQEGAYATGQVTDAYVDMGVFDHDTGGNYLKVITRPRTTVPVVVDASTKFTTFIANLTKEKIQHGVVVGIPTMGSVTGTYTSDGTVVNADILMGKVCYSQGLRKVGAMIDLKNGKVGSYQANESYYIADGTVESEGTTRLHVGGVNRSFEYKTTGSTGTTTKGLQYKMVGSGYFDATTTIDIPIQNLQPQHIKKDVQIGGTNSSIIGTYEGESTSVTGKVTSTGSTKSIIVTQDSKNTGTQNVNAYYVTVAGLTFKPSMIEIYDINTTNARQTVCTMYFNRMNVSATAPSIMLTYSGTSVDTAWCTIAEFSVTNTGFVLPCREGNKEYTWVAYK